MRRLYFLSIIALSLWLLLAGGCGGAGGHTDSSLFFVSKPFSFEVVQGSSTDLTVLGVNGIIEVSGSAAANTILISGVMKVGSASSAEARLHITDVDVEVSEAGGEVTVETVQPPQAMGLNYSVEYAITLPDTMAVDISQANGEISIRGTDSDLTASQANGTVDVDSVMPPGGFIDLSTANGDIILTLPTDTSSTIMCVSGTGRVRAFDLTIFNPVQGTHSLSRTLGAGDGDISITSANGDITVRGI